MKQLYFTVGPTQVHPKLQDFVKDAFDNDIISIGHRSKKFDELNKHTVEALKSLLGVPKDFYVFFVASATEAMERLIENCVEKNSYHFVNGAFSKKFFSIAQSLKRNPAKSEVAAGQGFDFAGTNIPKDCELVALTHNETSTGVQSPLDQIYSLKLKNPGKLFVLDIVSTVPICQIDFSRIDCAFFSVQKAFGLPAGLGVMVASESCVQKSFVLQDRGVNIGSYHNFPSLSSYARKHQTPATPNVLGIYLLGRVCSHYSEYGIQKIRQETEEKAQFIYDYLDKHPKYKAFVEKKEWRSPTTVVIGTPDGSAELIKKLTANGYTVSSGYDELKERHIRIANFPMQSMANLKKLLKLL